MSRKNKLVAYKDPDDPGNSKKFHTGKPCIESFCENPAGTYWSPFWCFPHNVIRIDRINDQLADLIKKKKRIL